MSDTPSFESETLSGPRAFQAIAVARGLRFYEKFGFAINTAYTPKNMIATATAITGQKFKARDLLGAAAALDGMVAKPGR